MVASQGRALMLAVDVGTSSCRAIAYDTQSHRPRAAPARVRYEPRITPDGGAELDPDLLLERVWQVVDGALGRLARGDRVVGVASATFWHSLIGLDRSGRALTPVYLWLDARSRHDAEALQATLDERAVHARTGCMLHWSYWPAKLRWLRRTRPGLFGQVARWVSFGEYLLRRVADEQDVSACMASGTGLMDLRTCTWDSPLLEALGVPPTALGRIRPLAERTTLLGGPSAARWPALTGAPWLLAVGDGATSNVGAGCTTRDRLALMVGTSAVLRVAWRTSQLVIPPGTWCYRLDEARVVQGGAMNDGGNLLDWLRETLRLPSLRRAEAALDAMPPDGHGLTVLPLWGGERSPGWAADARGAVVGLRLDSGPLDILRACLEAVALRFGELDGLLRLAVPEAREVIATGGALLRSPAWMQILADVLGRPVAASVELEASGRGVALLGLEALGLLEGSLDDLRPRVARVYEPRPAATERYAAAAERQQRLYRALIGGPGR